jgi:hypothetical protein
MGVAISHDDFLEECDGCGAVQLLDRLGLNPLGEFVNHYQEVRHAASGSSERAHHIQAPYGKRPGDGDGFQGGSRRVPFLGEALAAIALLHQFFCVSERSRPAVPEGQVRP